MRDMENGFDKKTHRLALAGQLCGATLLLTLISLPLPSGYGYVNLGDAGVYLCAMLLPGGLGALAAGVGAALADLILGWAVYAPATLIIKGLTAFLAGLAFRKAKKAALPLALLCCFRIVCTSISWFASVTVTISGSFSLSLQFSRITRSVTVVPNSGSGTWHFFPITKWSRLSPVAALSSIPLMVTVITGSACFSRRSFAQSVSSAVVVLLWSVSTLLITPQVASFLLT